MQVGMEFAVRQDGKAVMIRKGKTPHAGKSCPRLHDHHHFRRDELCHLIKHVSGTTSTYLQAHRMSDNYQHKERKRRNLERKVSAYSSGWGRGGVLERKRGDQGRGEKTQGKDEGTGGTEKPTVMNLQHTSQHVILINTILWPVEYKHR